MIHAIIYTSNTGHTEKYAMLLGEKTGLPVYSLSEGKKKLSKGEKVIYFGWISAMRVKGLKEARAQYSVEAVCAVGMCGTGNLIADIKKANSITDGTPLFTLQGGIDTARLRGFNRAVISKMHKGLRDKKNKTDDEKRMLELLSTGRDCVSSENLEYVLSFVRRNIHVA